MLNAAKGLLPLVQVKHAILADIDGIKEVLDDWVGRGLLAGKLVSFCHKFAEVGESDTAVFLDIEL